MWAQACMVLAVLTSAVLWIYVTPLYFISGGTYPEVGGFVGAMQVVEGGGTPDYILAAIPFFLILMLVELILTLVSKLECAGGHYVVDDAWSSLAAGITQQMIVALVKVPLKINIIPYAWVYNNIAVPNGLDKYAPVDNWIVWVLTFLAVDCCYYWFHRSAHEIQVLWAGHGIHHQSEYYNLSTALRQSWWASIAGWIFYLPMALLIHPTLYLTLDGANIVYQFWVHTCMVRRLPEPLEWIFMTPSHHRVHHDRRVHKNFGGFLIIWDRMFGSFQDEYDTVAPLMAAASSCSNLPQEEVMLFGSATKVKSWTEPVTQIQFWSPVTRALTAGEGGHSLIKAAVVGPGYYTTGTKRDIKVPSSTATRIRKKSELPLAGKVYVVATFIGVAVVTGLLVLLFSSSPWPLRALGGAVTLSALYCQGLLLDAEGRQGWQAEVLRCGACLVLAIFLIKGGEREGRTGMEDYHAILSSTFMRKFLIAMAVRARPLPG